ncbi:MAG: hypothetical protein AAGD11_20325 [Planctomycetota bacterium]
MTIALVVATQLCLEANTRAATQKYWELSPYRVSLNIAIDDAAQPRPGASQALLAALTTELRTTIYPLWKTTMVIASGEDKQRLQTVLDEPESPPEGLLDISKLVSGSDKQIFLCVRVTRTGIELRCREFDCTTQRWGVTRRRSVRQHSMLHENCFDLVCQTFSPLATIRSLPDSDSEVLLKFKGSELPQQADLSFLTVSGEPLQPMMVRTSSSGEIKADSIRDIPWTYLTLADQQDDGWHGKVHTGTRRPFGVRRRGRIEHLALSLRAPSGSTQVRFYARHDSTVGLTGYEVFRREPDATESVALGLTDGDGSVELTPTDQAVSLLFLRSEGQLLAKVPIVPGAKPLVEVPIADDTARLRAQSALTSLTEQLIDTVAKRNILIARVRDRIKNGDVDDAQELFTELDGLPGRSQFDRDIQTEKQRKLHQSSDPKVQARIDKLFADTRKLLSRFLSTKPISEVQGELTAARRGNSS